MKALPANKLFLAVLFFAAFGAAIFAVAVAVFSDRNVNFALTVPVVCLVALLAVMDIRWVLVLVFCTRSLLDPVLNMTKVSLGSGSVGVGAVINLIILGLCFLFLIHYWKRLPKNIPFAVPWVFFLAACAGGITHTPLASDAIRLFLNLSSYFLLFFTAILLIQRDEDIKFWIKILLGSSVLTVLIGDLFFVIHYPPFFLDYMDDTNRFMGTFTHPNIFSFYLVFMIMLCLYVFKSGLFRLKVHHKFLLMAYLLNLLFLLLATKTRSAWIACWVLFFLYGLLRDRKLLLISVLAPFLLLALPSVQERVTNIIAPAASRTHAKLNSFAWRVKLWNSSMEEIQEKPLVGHGLASFPYYSRIFFGYREDRRIVERGYAAHNTFLEILFDLGVTGLLAYLSIFFFIIRAAVLSLKNQVASRKNESAILLSYLVGFLACSFSDNMQYYLAFNWYFWFFMGLAYKMTMIRRDAPSVAKA